MLKKRIAKHLRALAARLDPQPSVTDRMSLYVAPPVTSCGSGGTARITHINGRPV